MMFAADGKYIVVVLFMIYGVKLCEQSDHVCPRKVVGEWVE
jgi:hypothetical protein